MEVIDRTERLMDFYRNQYPEIKFKIIYNYMQMYLKLLVKYKEDRFYALIPLNDNTKEQVNLIIMDFLAKIKITEDPK